MSVTLPGVGVHGDTDEGWHGAVHPRMAASPPMRALSLWQYWPIVGGQDSPYGMGNKWSYPFPPFALENKLSLVWGT